VRVADNLSIKTTLSYSGRIDMHNEGHQDIHPAHFQYQSDISQLSLGFNIPNDVTKEFMPTTELNWLMKEAGIHIEHELIESLCQHLNFAVNRQQHQPVMHVKCRRYEVIIYWNTWGVIRSPDGNLKAGLHVWNDEIADCNNQIISNSESWYLIGLLGSKFLLSGIYRTWIVEFLKLWAEENEISDSYKLTTNLTLINKLSDLLINGYGNVDQALTEIFQSLFAGYPNAHHLSWIAQNNSSDDKNTKYEHLYDDSAIRDALRVPFSCAKHERGMLEIYGKMWKTLSRSGESLEHIKSGKELLHYLGVTQNGRDRFYRLYPDELSLIYQTLPYEAPLLIIYLVEIQMTLQKLDNLRRSNINKSRPKLTLPLVLINEVISYLRQTEGAGLSEISNSKVRQIIFHLQSDGVNKHFIYELTQSDADNEDCRCSLIKNMVKLLVLYRDELLQTQYEPAIKEYTQHMTDFLRSLALVGDWFLATAPVIDKGRAKRGWKYLEKMAEEWHLRTISGDFSWALDFPDWKCMLASNLTGWNTFLQPDFPLQLVPLTTPALLVEESDAMDHCVASYVDECVRGIIRIFSVRDSATEKRIATAELIRSNGQWQLGQLKGKCNHEFIQLMQIADDPICLLMEALLEWYNHQHSLAPPFLISGGTSPN
jgi:hypothetical protein